MKRSFLALALAASLAAPALVFGGPFQEFETQLRAAYGQYRTALFQSNSGNEQATDAALNAWAAEWGALRAAWQETPPPQYADDPGFADTLDQVDAVTAKAFNQVAAGDLPGAHVTLEAIRDALGDLHMRNGIVTFSDRMNTYHARMEHVLETDFRAMGDAALGTLREEVAVLGFLAQDIATYPAPEARNPAYAGLVEGLQASVAALSDAVRSGDLDAALQAVGGLKMPYAKLFAKFG